MANYGDWTARDIRLAEQDAESERCWICCTSFDVAEVGRIEKEAIEGGKDGPICVECAVELDDLEARLVALVQP